MVKRYNKSSKPKPPKPGDEPAIVPADKLRAAEDLGYTVERASVYHEIRHACWEVWILRRGEEVAEVRAPWGHGPLAVYGLVEVTP